MDALKFESLIKQIILDWFGLNWCGLDLFGLNLIGGLDWIEIHALLKYNVKMINPGPLNSKGGSILGPLQLQGRIDPLN